MYTPSPRRYRSQGFTLVEIMIVVMTIGLLTAIAAPAFQRARKTAQTNTCYANIRQLSAAIDQYMIEERQIIFDPQTEEEIGAAVGPYLQKYPECPAGGVIGVSTNTTAPVASCTVHGF